MNTNETQGCSCTDLINNNTQQRPIMKQLHASKIADGITKIQFNDSVKNPYIKVWYYYPDSGAEGELSFKHSDKGHKDLQDVRESLAESICHLMELKNDWTLTKLKFDWNDYEVKASLERHPEAYPTPLKLKTPKINDMVLDELLPLFEEAAKYVTGEKRQQQEMFAEAS